MDSISEQSMASPTTPSEGGSSGFNTLHGGAASSQSSDSAAELPISTSYESGLVSVSTSVMDSLNALTIERDVADETKDLFITIDNPEKHNSAFDSYITFRITTKTTRPDYDNSEYCVRRRYNEFIWLRNRLELSHPAHLIPPLPEKHRARLDRYTLDFLKIRMIGLNRFINRLSSHPTLSHDKSFKVFVTANLPEFQSHKKQTSSNVIMKSLSESMHNMATSYMARDRGDEFNGMNEYIMRFSEKMGVMERIAARLHVEQQAYLNQLSSLPPVYTLWSSSEDRLRKPLDAIAKAVDVTYQALTEMVENYEIKTSLPIREYHLYSEAIKSVLKRRDAYQIEYELTVEELRRKKEEKEQLATSDQSYSLGAFLGKDPEEVRKEKQTKAQQQIIDLTKQVDDNSDQMTCANADLKADWLRWEVNKKQDVKSMLVSMADQQINYYQQCLDAWQSALPSISNVDSSE